VSGHSLTIEEMFQKLEASLERCGNNTMMKEEIIRQFVIDIQRYRRTTNPDGVQPDVEFLKRLNAAYLTSPADEPAAPSKEAAPAPPAEQEPEVIHPGPNNPAKGYVYVNGHTQREGA